MKCPKCNEEMKEGYIKLADAGNLYWSTTEMKSYWSYEKGAIPILQSNPVWHQGKENWLRRAYRCEKCGLITFEEKYTLSSEEKSW